MTTDELMTEWIDKTARGRVKPRRAWRYAIVSRSVRPHYREGFIESKIKRRHDIQPCRRCAGRVKALSAPAINYTSGSASFSTAAFSTLRIAQRAIISLVFSGPTSRVTVSSFRRSTVP